MISNHAVSRYLERVCGWNRLEAAAASNFMREAVERDIVSYRSVAAALALSDAGSQVVIAVGRFRIVCKGGRVVTILPRRGDGTGGGRIGSVAASITGKGRVRRESWRREVEA